MTEKESNRDNVEALEDSSSSGYAGDSGKALTDVYVYP